MKKLLSIVLTICLMLTFTPLGVFNLTANAATSGYYTYEVSDDEATITGCDTSISGDVIIPDTLDGYPVTSIGSNAFYGCSSLTNITIPEGVTSIGEAAFFGCETLTSIILPNGVTSVGSNAFEGCYMLAGITIPESVTSIGKNAFYNCSSLTSINVSSENTAYLSVDGVFFNKNKTELICYPAGKTATAYTIPDNVTSINDRAFFGCETLTSIILPNGVTSIGKYAFMRCSSLTSINLPASVTSIGKSAFKGCSSLTSITIPNGVTSIGDETFQSCESLINITLSDNITSIGNSAFQECTNLTSITIPDGVTSIGEYAFNACSSLTSITIPDSVTSISDGILAGCTKLTEITIPESVTSIGGMAFSSCINLTSITIPDSVTSIGSYAFVNCESLTSITIPDSVTSIVVGAFYYCSSLKNVYYTGTEAQKENITIGSSNDPLLYATWYCNSCIGSATHTYDDTYDIECNVCSNIKYTYTISNGEATITDCDITMSGDVVIPDTLDGYPVTSIGNGAFVGCESITSIKIHDGITSIGEHAFYGCYNLISITIPDCITSISDYVFDGCTNLTNVKIPDGVTSIGNGAFAGCESITSIKIPDGVTSIGRYAFSSCDNLTSIVIPDGIRYIDEGTFTFCSSLTSVTIPESVVYIGKQAFNNCSSLKNVYYGGTQTQKENITISSFNDPLINATWNYNCIPISYNGKEENVQWDDENKPILPKGYTDEQNKHFAIIGWTDKVGNEIDTSTLTVDNMVPLTAVVAEIPVDPTMLEANLIPTNDPYLPTGNKYINGFYVQGTQIRIPSDDENIKMGLRFVNILDNNLLTALKEGATDVSYGTIVMLKKYHNGGEVTLDTQNAAKVEGKNTFKYASEFNNQYLKYTVAITGITEEYFTEKFVIRPYISFTYNGNVVTLYGEQYEGASLYSAAKLAVAPDSIEDQSAKSWIQANIVNVVEKPGDNDVPSDDVFA